MLTCEQIELRHHFTGLGFSLVPGAMLVLRGDEKAASSLLAMLAGKNTPGKGRITFEDSPIRRNKEYQSLLLHVDRSNHLRRWERVEKAVARLASNGGGAMELVEAAMRYWALTEHRAARCGSLTAALKRRVSLTRLLTQPRPIWLLDTPEYGLDEEGLTMLDALIANRCNQHGIVVIATTRKGFMTPLPELVLADFAFDHRPKT